MKKDEMRFSIRFNPADSRHRKAALLLNMAGRRKAAIVADALWEYEMKYAVSAGDTKKPGNGQTGPDWSGHNGYEADKFQGKDHSHPKHEANDMRASILGAIGRFQES